MNLASVSMGVLTATGLLWCSKPFRDHVVCIWNYHM